MGFLTARKIETEMRNRALQPLPPPPSDYSSLGGKLARLEDTAQKYNPVNVVSDLIIPDNKYEKAFQGGKVETQAISGSALRWLGSEINSAKVKTFAEGYRQEQLKELETRGLQPTGQENLVEKTVRSTPNTLAALATTLIVGLATKNPMAARVAGGLSTGALEGGAAYQEALDRGASEQQAKVAARITGGINGAIETAIPWNIINTTIGKVLPKSVMGEAKKTLSKSVVDYVLKSGKTALGEGTQEFVQEVVSNLSSKYVYDPNQSWDENALESGKVGALMGLVFSLVPGAGGNQLHVQKSRVEEGAIEPAPEKQAVELPKPEEKAPNPVEDFKSIIKHIPEEHLPILTEAVSQPITAEAVSTLTPVEKTVIGIALNTAKQLPNADLVTIQKNIQMIQDTGVTIPTPKVEPVKVEKTPVEKPVLAAEKPVTKKEVKEEVTKAVEETKPPLQEGGKIKAYHGTTENFDTFDISKAGKSTDSGMFGKGFYFSDNLAEAKTYSVRNGKTGSVKEVQLDMKNPYIINKKSDIPKIDIPNTTIEDLKKSDVNYSEAFTKYLKDRGYDGVIDNMSPKGKQYVVFDKSQISQPQGITPKEKTLKLKYPKTKEKLTPTKLKNLGVVLTRQKIAQLPRYSKEFKENPIVTVKDGKLVFEGKTTKFSIVSKALGIEKLPPEGTKIKIIESELKNKEAGQIPEISYQIMTQRESEEAKQFQDRDVIYKKGITTFEEAEKQFRRFITKEELPVQMREFIPTDDMGGRAFGSTSKEMVSFVRNPKENTAPHEAVHAYIKLFVGQKKYDNLISYIKKNKTLRENTTENAEEWLADNFEYYIKEQKMKAQDSKLMKLFKWIKAQILKLAGKEDKIESFYKSVYEKKRPGKIEKILSKKVDTGVKFQEAPLTSPTGQTINAKEVFKSAWRKLYGEEATIKLEDLLKREADKEIIKKEVGIAFSEGKNVQRAKNAEKVKEIRAKLRKDYKDKSKSIDDIKKQVVEYVKYNLPTVLHGKYLMAVKKAKTNANLAKVQESVDKRRNLYERKLLNQSIGKILKNINKLPIDIQRSIIKITDQIELKKHTKRLLERLQRTQEYLDRMGTNKDMPDRVLKELGILKRTPYDQVTTDQLIAINNQLQQYNTVGRNILKDKAVIRKMTAKEKLGELSKGSLNLDKLTRKERFGIIYKRNLSTKGKALLKLKGFREWLMNINLKQIGTDRAVSLLDNGNPNGPNATLLMNPIDDAVNIAFQKKDTFTEEFNQILLPLRAELSEGLSRFEKAKRILSAFKRENHIGQNIAVLAFVNQKGGREKLLEAGTVTEEEIQQIEKEVAEDPVQQAMYKYMRNRLDEIFPKLKKSFEILNPTETINFVENFFPMRTDYNLVSVEKDEGNYGAGLNFESLKHRKIDAKQVLRLNAMSDFQNYMEKAIFYIETAETIRDARDIIQSKEYEKVVGVNAAKFMRTWLKITARQGGYLLPPRAFERGVDFLRKNIAASTLGLRPSTIVRQSTAWANGAAAIGAEYQSKGSAMYAGSAWRAFIKKASPQMVNRLGGDILWQDLSEKETIKKLQEMSMAGTRLVDYVAASTTWLGAYQKKMDELGIKTDKNVVNEDARRYADLMVRISQGTAQFHKAPQFLFNENRSLWRMFYMFETFALSNWSQWVHDVPQSWKTDKVAASKKVAWLTTQTLASAGITYLNGAIMASLFGDGDDDKEKSYKKSVVSEFIQTVPFLNKIYSSYNYDRSPIVITQFFGDLISSLRWSFLGKKPETRMKHQIRAAASIGIMFSGLPPKFVVEMLTKAIDTSPKSKFNQ